MPRKKKSPAQLDAEIASVLATPHMPDVFEVVVERHPGSPARTIATYATYDEAKRRARAAINEDENVVQVCHSKHYGPDDRDTRYYTFKDGDYIDEHPEKL